MQAVSWNRIGASISQHHLYLCSSFALQLVKTLQKVSFDPSILAFPIYFHLFLNPGPFYCIQQWPGSELSYSWRRSWPEKVVTCTSARCQNSIINNATQYQLWTPRIQLFLVIVLRPDPHSSPTPHFSLQLS